MPIKHSIITRTVANETDKRAVVRHPLPLVRTIGYGNDWNRIRLGARISNVVTSTLSAPPLLYMGMCSGVQNLPLSAKVDHFFGVRSGTKAWNSRTNGMESLGSQYDMLKIENTAETVVSKTSTGYGFAVGRSTVMRSCMWVELTRSGGNIQVELYAYWAVPPDPVHSVSLQTFWNVMQAPSLSSAMPSGHMRIPPSPSPASMPVDEATHGPLDTICFAWGGYRDYMAFEVSDFDYTRFS